VAPETLADATDGVAEEDVPEGGCLGAAGICGSVVEVGAVYTFDAGGSCFAAADTATVDVNGAED
jgi:hypothetical protein